MAGNESHPESLKLDPVINISLPVRQSTRTFLMNLSVMCLSQSSALSLQRDKQQRLKLLRSQMGIGFLPHISKFYIKTESWLRLSAGLCAVAGSQEHWKSGTLSTACLCSRRKHPAAALPLHCQHSETAQSQGCTLSASFSWSVILVPMQATMPSLKLRKLFLSHFKYSLCSWAVPQVSRQIF